MRGILYINGKDAYTTWGITMGQEALSALMTPAPLKRLVENKSRAEDGKQVLGISNDTSGLYRPRVDERQLNLTINLTAPNEAEFMRRYASFCEELKKGKLDIRTSYQSGVVYHTIYEGCQQFSQFLRGIALFGLRLTEYNPNNRTI
ncbi:MAG: hypothetical protein Q4A64_03405 [Porphyromonadaceae bacterium]|nr:hypothetical protein [Porphyromonadaceae bacterium]